MKEIRKKKKRRGKLNFYDTQWNSDGADFGE